MRTAIAVLCLFLVSGLFAQLEVRNSDGTLLMSVNNEGNVGIGLSRAPSEKLDVGGMVRTQSLRVTSGSPAAGKVLVATNATGTATWGSNNDADFEPNAERQHLSFNSSTYELTIDDGGQSSGNTVTLPSPIDVWSLSDDPRNILIEYNGNAIEDVWVYDGPIENFNLGSGGWTTTTDYTEVTWSDNTGNTGLGIMVPPTLANISDPSIKALQVRMGAFKESTTGPAPFYGGYSSNSSLKQMGDVCESIACEANGLLFLDSIQNFYMLSQHQSNPDLELTKLFITIFGGVR